MDEKMDAVKMDENQCELVVRNILDIMKKPLPNSQMVSCSTKLSDRINTGVLAVTCNYKGLETIRLSVFKEGTAISCDCYLTEIGTSSEDITKWLNNTDVSVPMIVKTWRKLADNLT